MKKTRLKVLASFVAVAFVTLSVVSIGYASGGYKKTLEAWFGLTNISYNGQDLTKYAEPFAVNDTTYVPLRKMCDMFKKDIEWDQATHTVIIKDRPTYVEAQLKTQVALKDYQISQLEARIAELENKLNFYENAEYDSDDDDLDEDFKDLEDALNDDYDEYRDIEFDISIDGDEDEITVEIEVDLDDFDDEWDDLTTSRKTRYLQDICDDILDEFEDADIEGSIIDISEDEELLSFYTDSDGDVAIGERIDPDDLDDLEDDLDDDYYDYFDDIYFDSIELDEDDGEITFIVNIDMDEYDDEWYDLTDQEVEDFMYEIRDDILDEFDNAVVEGIVFDIDEDEEIAWLEEVAGGTSFDRD